MKMEEVNEPEENNDFSEPCFGFHVSFVWIALFFFRENGS